MNKWTLAIAIVLSVGLLLAAFAWFSANSAYRQRMAEADAVWAEISSRAKPTTEGYRPDLVADLPEIAQRYFNHAMSVGTPLASTVELKMEGSFVLGDADKPQTFDMTARQILAPPLEFVWIVEMISGAMVVSGTDALHDTRGWMRFWAYWAIPLVQTASSEGFDRSAAARPALEAIWLPASLLPSNGARWEQLASDKARVTFSNGERPIEMSLTIAPDGRVVDVSTMRWSDANPEKVFRLQPFGGTVEEEATFGGVTIPSLVHVGNHYGTDDYFAFFNARIVEAKFY